MQKMNGMKIYKKMRKINNNKLKKTRNNLLIMKKLIQMILIQVRKMNGVKMKMKWI